MRALNELAGYILQHISLWYGGGLTADQARAIANCDGNDYAYIVRNSIAMVGHGNQCLPQVRTFEMETGRLMNGQEIKRYVIENCHNLSIDLDFNQMGINDEKAE